MKLTKGMKKALSLLLSAAMVVTGVNVTTGKANAAEKIQWTGEIEGDEQITWSSKYATGGEGTATGMELGFNGDLVWIHVTSTEFASYKNPMITVKTSASEVSVGEGKDKKTLGQQYAVLTSDADKAWGNPLPGTVIRDGALYDADGTKGDKATEDQLKEICALTELKAKLSADQVYYGLYVGQRTITSIEIADVKEQVADPTKDVTDTTNDVTDPTKDVTDTTKDVATGNDEKFTMNVSFCPAGWNGGDWATADFSKIEITGNGIYSYSYDMGYNEKDPNPAEGVEVWCADTDLPTSFKDVKVQTTAVQVNDLVVDAPASDWTGKDQKVSENYRLNIINSTNYYVADGTGYEEGKWKQNADAAVGVDCTKGMLGTKSKYDPDANGAKVHLYVGDRITVFFKVTGMAKDKADDTVKAPEVNYDEKKDYTQQGSTGKPQGAYPPIPVETDAPAPTATAPTKTPTKTPTRAGITTPAGVTTPVAATKKLTVAKKSVVVAPNKSVSVKFKATAATTAGAAKVTASVASKKVVKSATVKGSKVTIKAAKKAVRGASTIVTLKSDAGNGKVKSAKIKVYIQNKAKKVKATKKSITLKKGKKAKLTLKVTAQNKKKATTDAVKVSSKVVKLASTSAKKGKVVVTLKGKKKGSQKVTIKVGSKKVKVNVKVK